MSSVQLEFTANPSRPDIRGAFHGEFSMASTPTQSQSRASFPITLNLPGGPLEFLDEASEAIKWACRNTAQWKKVRCYGVRRLKGRGKSWQTPFTLYALDMGDSLDFDWTWENSLAIAPADVETFRTHAKQLDVDQAFDPRDVDQIWSGEIVEVDRVEKRLFICSNDPTRRPTAGTFYVQTHRDLVNLAPVFCRPQFENFRRALASRLSATRGRVHPHIIGDNSKSLPEFESIWSHAWSILWPPPGTCLHQLLAKQIALTLDDERILVVSSTNKSLDQISLAVGRQIKAQSGASIVNGEVQRLGRTPYQNSFLQGELSDVLQYSTSKLMSDWYKLCHQRKNSPASEINSIDQQISDVVAQIHLPPSRWLFDAGIRVAMCGMDVAVSGTKDQAFRAMFAQGEAPFTTVIIDHAGLVPRAQLAAISLLASRRVILVGDPKRHHPSNVNYRVLPTGQATWLSRSGMDDLVSVKQKGPYICVLNGQNRMHPEVCELVSAYQYNNLLDSDESIENRESILPDSLASLPRCVWYVLDDDVEDELSPNAEPGRMPHGWTRPKTIEVLKKFFADEQVRAMRGLFVTPFAQQAREVSAFFADQGMYRWTATTPDNSTQLEADLVIFDPVNASSTTWQENDWRRMITTGISAAREFVMLIATRAEMQQSFLRPLASHVARRILVTTGDNFHWKYVSDQLAYEVPNEIAEDPVRLGYQIQQRKKLRHVLNAEQQRLCDGHLLGRPHLVHGVAGSGKTIVMANALVKTIDQLSCNPEAIIWAIYGNASAKELIHHTIEEAWSQNANGTPFPWHRVEVFHVRELLELLLREQNVRVFADVHYDRLAATYFTKVPANEIEPRCDAMFIDEAQDLGTSTIRLLARQVRPMIESNPNSRTITLFYDDAQDLDGTHTIHWDEIGLDIREQRTVMRESFRATRVINEFSLNVLYRLEPPEDSDEHKQLVEAGLIEEIERDESNWWRVRHNQVEGPLPTYRVFTSIEQQLNAIGDQLIEWIRDEGIQPSDITVLYAGRAIAKQLRQQLRERLVEIGTDLFVPTVEDPRRDDNSVALTTPSKFKGYESEVVLIAGLDEFVCEDTLEMARKLYVAMTRARSVLAIFAKNRHTSAVTNLLTTVQDCWNELANQSVVDDESSVLDELADLTIQLGAQHESWLKQLCARNEIHREPIVLDDGEILADPIFWFRNGSASYACFGNRKPGRQTQFRLSDANFKIIQPGDSFA